MIRMNTSDEDLHCLLTITHKRLIEPVRVVSDTINLVSNGDTYLGFPFEFVFPQEDDAVPKGRIRIQNVDRRIGHTIKGIKDTLLVRLDTVLRSDPDEIEFTYKYLYLMNAKANNNSIEGDLSGKNFSTLTYPNVKANKTNFPGLFPP